MEVVLPPRRWGRYPEGVEPPPMPAFTVLKRRWVIERTFAWLGNYRRLSRDYEFLPATEANFIYLAIAGSCSADSAGRRNHDQNPLPDAL